MAGKTSSVNINIVADASKAVRGFKDAGSAGEALEKTLKKAADKMEAELKQTADIADLLAEKLGPGFRTTIGQTPEDIARQFAKTGITLQDLESNVDGVTAQLRRLEAQADHTSAGVTSIGHSADKTGDATRSLAGNAVGDFAAMQTGIGPLGEAVSQLTERIAAGEASLRGFATAGLGMAAIAGGMWAVSKGAQQAAKRTEELGDAVDRFSKVADDEVLRLYGRSLLNVALNGGDVNKFLKDLATNNEVGARRLLDTMKAAGMSADAMWPLRDALREVDREQRQQYETEKRYGEEIQKIPGFIQDILPKFDSMTEAVKDQVGWVDWLDGTWSAFWDKLDAQALTRDLYSALFIDKADLERQVQLVGQYVEQVLRIPPNVMDKLIPMIEQGQVDLVWSMVSALQHIRDMVSTGSTRMGEAALIGLGFVPGVAQNARGTVSAQPGLSWVGEKGPELIQLRGGERIWPSGTGPSGAAGGPQTFNVYVNGAVTGDDVVNALKRWTRENGELPVTTTTTVVR